MARPKNQAKRREELVSATAQAVLRHGPTGTRLAHIAQEAGLTSAAVLYYYPDVHELFTAVFEQGTVEYCEHREERVSQARSVLDKLRVCIRSGIPRPGAGENASRILYELTPVVLRDDKAAASYTEFIDRQAALYEEILLDGDSSGELTLAMPADVLARSLVALEDGYGIHVLTGALKPEQEEAWLLAFAAKMTASPALLTKDHDMDEL